MPELPEVEASRKFVEDHCLGQPIVRAEVQSDTKVLCNVSAQALEEALTGRTIVRAGRKGKHLWLELDQRPWPVFQFEVELLIEEASGMCYKHQDISWDFLRELFIGLHCPAYMIFPFTHIFSLRTRSAANDEEEWPSKYAKVLVELGNGVQMAFTDSRRFARIRLLQDPPTESPISELGPDAYLELPDNDAFRQAVQLRKGSIKGVILDQSFLAGIGNWIADEVLYQARIHPETLASNMTSEDCGRLHRAIQEVVYFSVTANADHENFPKHWLFHLRWNKRPGSLDGNKIDFIKVGGRTSAYVPALQTPMFFTTSKKSSRKEKTLDGCKLAIEKVLKARSSVQTSRKSRKAKICDTKDEVILEERKTESNVFAESEAARAIVHEKPSKRRKKSDPGDALESRKAVTKIVRRTGSRKAGSNVFAEGEAVRAIVHEKPSKRRKKSDPVDALENRKAVTKTVRRTRSRKAEVQ
ncbi:hypothetical protein AXG93_3384s1790 [Marchantia polymorpha subsp. ruderalis]|uniref:Formamidopyrimidine-DNA glycosylase catalytic domain-containing protein n=1 Tax=Marchantia polymorpha subsp. ruderalis TaxID=1480154 RepID=A0A176WHC7_MARPO|nr:hypothetical protein AXG93_3384s1790 [Marchantia polymorpha subsp. ruderalis]